MSTSVEKKLDDLTAMITSWINRRNSMEIDKDSPDPLLQFFRYEHLPSDLQVPSKHFAHLAEYVTSMLPRNPERTVCLRKLLEAKDCAVRAALYKA